MNADIKFTGITQDSELFLFIASCKELVINYLEWKK